MTPLPSAALCKEQNSSKQQRGFALIITVVLVAFLVLILVALATFTRVETQVAGNTQQLAAARQNALFALNLAVGELQRTAGPDRRVTATADILSGTHPSRARLTGVWQADDMTEAPEWLISGTPAQRTNVGAMLAPSATAIGLVGANSTDISQVGNRIVVPTQEVRADVEGLGANQLVGRVAWWVGDEGVKARVNLVDEWAGAAAADRINSWTLAQRAGGEVLRDNTATPLGATYPINDPEIAKILDRSQFLFLAGNATQITQLRNTSRARFHDISFNSRSVMTNTAEGGLRKDLSAWLRGGALPAGAPSNTDYIFRPQDMGVGAPLANDFFTLPTWGLIRDFDTVRFDGTPIAPRAATDTQQGISPVMTYARLGFAISGVEGGVLRLHLFPILVLWNPYSAPLQAATYEFGMFHRNSNDARITFHSGSPAGLQLGELHLARASFPTAPATGDRFFRFRVNAGVIPPGESHVFTLPDAADGGVYDPLATTLTRGNRQSNSVLMLGSVPLPASHFPADATPADEVYWVRDLAWTGQGEMDAALRLVTLPEIEPFEGRDLRASALQSIQRFAGQGGANMPSEERLNLGGLGPINPRFGMALEAKMGGVEYVNARWIAGANYRAQLNLRTAGNPDNPDYRGFVNNSGIPTALMVFDGDRASAGRRVREVPAQNVVLAEILPANAPLASLAQLQHANLARLSSYPGNAVGNSHPNHRLAGELIQRPLAAPPLTALSNLVTRTYDFSYGLNQALWDRYFFSTVPGTLSAADLADPDYLLPHARMQFFRADGAAVALADVRDPVAYERAAANMMLEGGININSTSVEAWRTWLAARNGLEYNPEAGTTGAGLSHPISRFSTPRGGSTNIWSGYRTLTDDQINQLAQDIVAQVRLRGPFASVADFVNRRPLVSTSPNYAFATKGTLQAALDATTTGAGAVNAATVAPFNDMGANSTPTTGEVTFYQPDLIRGNTSTTNVAPWSSLMAFAPGMVSQADLLNALGPIISARSDTFLVRTYGESLNPATGERQGSAYLEAIVQRVPDYVESSLDDAWVFPPTNTDNVNFGRRFVVVGFRWLSPSDL